LKSQVHLLLEQVSLLSPPDIAGTICDELERYERRPVPELRPLTALAALSMANYNRKAYGGGNLHFQGLGVAKSSSGKEAHIGFTKKLLAGIGLADKVATKPRSDKNIYLDLIDNEYLLYCFDEVHSFFQQGTNKNASAFEAGMVSVLLEVCTSEILYLPGKTRDDLIQKYEALINKLSDKSNLSEKQELSLNKCVRIVDRLNNGWEDPFLTLVGYSTPINMDMMINEHNIEQGLIGRFIFLRSPNIIREYTGRTLDKPSAELTSRLANIMSTSEEISITPDAEETLTTMFNFLELNEHRNHPKLGALYARGYKWITLISSILASETGKIQHEHICYATKLFMYNIHSCEAVLNGESDLEVALLAKAKLLAVRYATPEQGIGRGALASKMINCCTEIKHYRKKKKDICHVLIDQLIEDGVIVQYGSVIQIAA
jgi:hypothetical protein